MLKRYKNELLAVIQRNGLDPLNFLPVETTRDDLPAFVLRFKESGLEFIVRNPKQDPHAFDCSYTPFFPGRQTQPVDYIPDSGFLEFDSVLDEFTRWIAQHVNDYIAEESVPDLWEALQAGAFLSEESIQQHDESFFSEPEKVQIKIAVVSFQQAIVEQFHPSDDKLAAIEKQIKYLSDAVDRLNRFDWKGVAVSTLLGICTNLSLDTERGRQLYGLFQQAMTAVLHLLK
jgi:hypothetical protein